MSENIPTPWMGVSEATAARVVACVNAFPDDMPTECITKGLVGEMRAVLHLLAEPYENARFQPANLRDREIQHRLFDLLARLMPEAPDDLS